MTSITFDVEFTTRWWEKLLKDDERMVRWLQKLQVTEYEGYQDNRDAADKWAGDNPAIRNVLIATGDDEMRHSDLLIKVLQGRGAWPVLETPPPSDYWNEMEKVNDSLEACAAIFHLGEQLASDRFEVLYNHPETPADIYEFLHSALPDERHHARVFRRMTNDEVLARVLVAHNQAVFNLRGS